MLDRFQAPKADKDGGDSASLNKVDPSGSPGSAPADRVEISDTAHQLMDLRQAVDSGRMALGVLPEVREDKLEEVRAKLQQGFYQSVEVRDKVAGALGGVLRNLDQL